MACVNDFASSSSSSSTMISDFYAARTRVPSSMTSSNSANSFDFVGVLDPNERQLLSASVSMESLWSIDSDDTVPPFPDRPTAPITPILLDDRCMLFPRGRGSKVEADDYKILTTVATPPRMKNLLLEPLCVDLWADTIIIRVPPPGHIPWERAAPALACPWVPSGSLYHPSFFKRTLNLARNARKKGFAPPATFGSVKPRTSRLRSSSHQGSSRKALVFEREITLSTDGRKKRWSLQIPAATMNPEMVDMMLELQDLNSFFKDSLEDLEESVAVLEKEKDRLDPLPTLTISDSHCTFPVSIESSAQPQREPPIPLAARRGKSLLPPLSLTEKRAKNSYPNIPTAFLGSPSAYSPKFDHANAVDDPSLGLEDMVTSLRSWCDYPQRMDRTDFELIVDSPVSAMSFAPASDQNTDDDDDDWAFAVSFLDEFGSQMPDLSLSLEDGYQDLEIKSRTPNKGLSAGGDVLPIELLTPRVQSPVYVPPSPFPSTPLPATPVLRGASVSRLSSPKGVRGILKSCKNVRFASLPNKPEEDDIDIEPFPITPPAAALPVIVPPERPSRIRAYSRSSKQVTENTPIHATPQSCRPTSAYAPAGTKAEKIVNTRPVSVAPSALVDPFQSKNPAYSGHNRSPSRRSTRNSAALARKSTPVSLGRQSFVDLHQENETKGGTFPRGKAASRWTMNDMTFRRGSNASQQSPEETPKSRMPVPLRNILTRFK